MELTHLTVLQPSPGTTVLWAFDHYHHVEHLYLLNVLGFQGDTTGKPVCQCKRQTWVEFLGREGALEKGMGLTPVFLPGEAHEQRSLLGYSS